MSLSLNVNLAPRPRKLRGLALLLLLVAVYLLLSARNVSAQEPLPDCPVESFTGNINNLTAPYRAECGHCLGLPTPTPTSTLQNLPVPTRTSTPTPELQLESNTVETPYSTYWRNFSLDTLEFTYATHIAIPPQLLYQTLPADIVGFAWIIDYGAEPTDTIIASQPSDNANRQSLWQSANELQEISRLYGCANAELFTGAFDLECNWLSNYIYEEDDVFTEYPTAARAKFYDGQAATVGFGYSQDFDYGGGLPTVIPKPDGFLNLWLLLRVNGGTFDSPTPTPGTPTPEPGVLFAVTYPDCTGIRGGENQWTDTICPLAESSPAQAVAFFYYIDTEYSTAPHGVPGMVNPLSDPRSTEGADGGVRYCFAEGFFSIGSPVDGIGLASVCAHSSVQNLVNAVMPAGSIAMRTEPHTSFLSNGAIGNQTEFGYRYGFAADIGNATAAYPTVIYWGAPPATPTPTWTPVSTFTLEPSPTEIPDGYCAAYDYRYTPTPTLPHTSTSTVTPNATETQDALDQTATAGIDDATATQNIETFIAILSQTPAAETATAEYPPTGTVVFQTQVAAQTATSTAVFPITATWASNPDNSGIATAHAGQTLVAGDVTAAAETQQAIDESTGYWDGIGTTNEVGGGLNEGLGNPEGASSIISLGGGDFTPHLGGCFTMIPGIDIHQSIAGFDIDIDTEAFIFCIEWVDIPSLMILGINIPSETWLISIIVWFRKQLWSFFSA